MYTEGRLWCCCHCHHPSLPAAAADRFPATDCPRLLRRHWVLYFLWLVSSLAFGFWSSPTHHLPHSTSECAIIDIVASAETSSTSQQSLSLLSCATILTQGHDISIRMWLCGCPDHHIQLCERIHVIATPKMDRSTSPIPSSSAWLTLRREEWGISFVSITTDTRAWNGKV